MAKGVYKGVKESTKVTGTKNKIKVVAKTTGKEMLKGAGKGLEKDFPVSLILIRIRQI